MPRILPSPTLDSAASVAWLLQNPLLLAAYPDGIARRAYEVANGQLDGAKLLKLATDLSVTRKQLSLSKADPANQEAYEELLGLLQSRHLTRDEVGDLGHWIRTARPSEYPWLRGPIAATIQSRADAKEAKLLLVAQAVGRATNTKIIRASQLAA